MPGRTFMMFAEVNMLFGDMFDAFVEKRGQWNFPTDLLTATSSEAHYDWWMHAKRGLLKEKHLAGTLQVAGFAPLSETIPQDVIEKAPVPPQLGKMTCSGPDDDKHLCIPEAVVRQRYHHPVYGRRFRPFMDSFHEEPPAPSPNWIAISDDADGW